MFMFHDPFQQAAQRRSARPRPRTLTEVSKATKRHEARLWADRLEQGNDYVGFPDDEEEEHPATSVVVYPCHVRSMREAYGDPIDESTKGPYPFRDKQRQYAKYSDQELRFALKDAHEAMMAMKGHDPQAENWYLDDMSTIEAEINNRRAGKRGRRRSR